MAINWNMVTGIAAIVALPIAVIGAVPVISGWVADWNAPEAAITSISDFQQVTGAFDVSGTFGNIEGSDSLFLIALSGVEGRFYPIAEIDTHTENGSFSTEGDVVRLASGEQELQLYMLPARSQESISTYIQSRTGAGLGNLPSEAHWLSTTHVIVNDSSSGAAPSSQPTATPPTTSSRASSEATTPVSTPTHTAQPPSTTLAAEIDTPSPNAKVALAGTTVSGRIIGSPKLGRSFWLVTFSDGTWFLDQAIDVRTDGTFSTPTGQIGDPDEHGTAFTFDIMVTEGSATAKIESTAASVNGGDVVFARIPGSILGSVTVTRS